MTQFQESASVRTLGTPRAADTAPFLAIMAGLVAVLMAVAVISFVVDRTALRRGHQWHRRLGGGRRILGGPDRREQAAPARGSGSGDAATDHRNGRPAAARSAQQLRDGWAAALAMQRPITATDGWEAALLQPKEDAVDTYSQRFITAD